MNRDCKQSHECKKRCFEPCDPCPIKVQKLRSCGHSYLSINCSQNVEEVTCKRRCQRKIPDCGHSCQLKCYEECGNCQKKVCQFIVFFEISAKLVYPKPG